MRDQRHTTAALPPRKGQRCQSIEVWVGPRPGLHVSEKRKPYDCPVRNPERPVQPSRNTDCSLSARTVLKGRIPNADKKMI